MTERNVVLLTFDSLRADHCSHHGYERDTAPTLSELASEGVTFENAIAPASRTNPAMAGAFTGEPMVVRDRVADPEHSRRHLRRHGTVAETFADAGYATGAFCPNAYASRFYGFDRGFETFEDFLFDSGLYQTLFDKHLSDSSLYALIRNVRNLLRRQEAFKTWDTYVDDVVSWATDRTEPVFLWVFSLDTHFPYLTPGRHRAWGSLPGMYYYNWRCNQLIDELDPDVDAETKQRIVDIYDDTIRFADEFIATLRDRLAALDPVFVVHGDHGEALFEHGVYGHFYPSLYEENVHVPLVVSGTDERATVEDPVSLVDLPAVLRRAGGLDEGPVAELGSDWVVATDYDGRNDRNLVATRTARWKYLRSDAGESRSRECYDLATDPSEGDDLVGRDRAVEEPLAALTDRRLSHEHELSEIAGAVRGLFPSGPAGNARRRIPHGKPHE